MITFIVQNETHALNFKPIVENLISLGISEANISTLHFDRIFGLETYAAASIPNQHLVEMEISAPYYRLSGIRRFAWLLRHGKDLQQFVTDTHVLIIGSDGALQRCMANSVRTNGGRVILIVDGLLHPWPKNSEFRARVKNKLNRLLGKINLNHLTPADIGHSNLDLIYVMNSAICEILRRQGIKTPIKTTMMPRFSEHICEYQAIVAKQPQSLQHRCLYATGAYKWHGLMKEDQCQEQDLRDIVRFAQRNSEWLVRVRIHPRESIEDYNHQPWPGNIEFSAGSSSVLDDLAWASVVVTARSTLAFEAEMVGVPVLIYTRNFGYPSSDSFFAQNQYFNKSDDLVVLSNILSQDRLPASDYVSGATSIAQNIAAIGQGI